MKDSWIWLRGKCVFDCGFTLDCEIFWLWNLLIWRQFYGSVVLIWGFLSRWGLNTGLDTMIDIKSTRYYWTQRHSKYLGEQNYIFTVLHKIFKRKLRIISAGTSHNPTKFRPYSSIFRSTNKVTKQLPLPISHVK